MRNFTETRRLRIASRLSLPALAREKGWTGWEEAGDTAFDFLKGKLISLLDKAVVNSREEIMEILEALLDGVPIHTAEEEIPQAELFRDFISLVWNAYEGESFRTAYNQLPERTRYALERDRFAENAIMLHRHFGGTIQPARLSSNGLAYITLEFPDGSVLYTDHTGSQIQDDPEEIA